MVKTRIIATLLLSNKGIVKSNKFDRKRYIGDPINTLKIFNDQEAQEIVILDIDKYKDKNNLDFNFLKKITSECFCPLTYGGGIKTLDEAIEIFKCGFEKILFNKNLFINPELVKSLVSKTGSQSIVACIEYISATKKVFLYDDIPENFARFTLEDVCKYCESLGVGEILLQSRDKDGSFSGLDFDIYEEISKNITIPIILSGGCKDLEDIKKANFKKINGIAASSIFIFLSENKGVLINYPSKNEINRF